MAAVPSHRTQDRYDEHVHGHVSVGRVRQGLISLVVGCWFRSCPCLLHRCSASPRRRHMAISVTVSVQVKIKAQKRDAALRQEKLHAQEVAQLKQVAHRAQVGD